MALNAVTTLSLITSPGGNSRVMIRNHIVYSNREIPRLGEVTADLAMIDVVKPSLRLQIVRGPAHGVLRKERVLRGKQHEQRCAPDVVQQPARKSADFLNVAAVGQQIAPQRSTEIMTPAQAERRCCAKTHVISYGHGYHQCPQTIHAQCRQRLLDAGHLVSRAEQRGVCQPQHLARKRRVAPKQPRQFAQVLGLAVDQLQQPAARQRERPKELHSRCSSQIDTRISRD